MKPWTLAFFVACLLLGCGEKSPENQLDYGKIPAFEVSANDPKLLVRSDSLLYDGKMFSGFVLDVYPNGSKASKKGYLEGRLEGPQERFYPDGSVMELRFYQHNRKSGSHKGWWPNRKLKFEYTIIKDIPVGEHDEWYENGQMYSLATYDTEGQPSGKQPMWYATGQIKANYVIKDGRRYGFLGAKGCMGENEKRNTGLKEMVQK